ncbi:MAG: M56 family metallopeptidase [Gemmatimonas sp.]
MTIAWMLYALGVGVLVAIAAASAEWALKSAQRSVRFVWVSAIAITLLFTLVAPLRVPKPQARVTLPALTLIEAPVVTAAAPTWSEMIVANGRAALNLLVLPVQKTINAAKSVSAVANISASVFWLLSAIIAFVVLLTVYVRSMRESVRWPLMNVLGRTVRVAPDVGPAVMGVAPPEIIIPRWVLKRDVEEQRLVLEHESEHVRAHDPLLLVFACVAVALMPWNAAVWFMWSRLRLAVELDCDRRVLSRGVRKPAYGELLVELSSRRPWNSLAMPAFSWGTSHLEKRLVAMTARPERFSVARRLASGGVVALALVAACQSEMPTGAEVAAMDVSTMTARVPGVSDSTIFFVNERKVSQADAKAILATDISSVEIKRSTKSRPVSEVHVTLANDSTRKLRVGSTGDSRHNTALGDEVIEVAGKTGVTVTGDSITTRLRSTRDLSLVAPEKAGAMELAPLRRTNTTTVMTDSRVATVGGMPRFIFRDPSCLPTGSVKLTNILIKDGEMVSAHGVASADVAPATRPCNTGSPLFVIDGVIVENGSLDAAQLKSMDVESIEVIKGAAASRLYGERAANGVILIQTKK